MTKQLIRYVGHSQGTTQMFAALSDPVIRPTVAPYVKAFYALAPIVYLNQNHVPVVDFATTIRGLIKFAALRFGVNYLEKGTCLWDQYYIDKLNKQCGSQPKSCYKEVKYTDLVPKVNNWARAGYRALLEPSGASVNSFLHYAQILDAQRKNHEAFPKFDYGPSGNRQHYGNSHPPNYDLSLIREKVRLWMGTADALGTTPETHRIVKNMVNAPDVQVKYLRDWGHETFHFALDNHYYLELAKHLAED